MLEEAGVWSGDHRQTCQVIDRYRFMSLLPLTLPELKSIGYQVSYRVPICTFALFCYWDLKSEPMNL